MDFKNLTNNWPRTIAFAIITVLLFWTYGCPPKVESLSDPGRMVTRPELQIELNMFIASAEYRMADLDKQDAFRNVIFRNALVLIDGGTINPLGIITGVAAIYGLGTAGKQVKDKIKKKTV